MSENKYKTRQLLGDDYKLFENLYNDFITRAKDEYKFELDPLNYKDFIDSIEKNLIECLVLYENDMPAAFLIYTTMISEAIELNIIHSMNMENFVERSSYLIKRFLELTKIARKTKIVCYPMLGVQKTLIGEIARYGFKFVGIAVLRFMMSGTNSREILKLTHFDELNPCYTIVPWSDEFLNESVQIVQEAFETSADALFDPRFKSLEGTYDIINKITNDIYAEFMPEATSVLLCSGIPVGFCFINLTGGTIANIPIVAIKKEHQGKGLSKYMLKNSLDKLMHYTDTCEKNIVEINTTTETNNFQALKMYYNYPQSYLPVKD